MDRARLYLESRVKYIWSRVSMDTQFQDLKLSFLISANLITKDNKEKKRERERNKFLDKERSINLFRDISPVEISPMSRETSWIDFIGGSRPRKREKNRQEFWFTISSNPFSCSPFLDFQPRKMSIIHFVAFTLTILLLFFSRLFRNFANLIKNHLLNLSLLSSQLSRLSFDSTTAIENYFFSS